MSEKDTINIEKGRPESSHDPSKPAGQVDAAWQFLDAHHDKNAAVITDGAYLARLRQKIDWHIVPLMFLCYTMQFLDKVILNVCHSIISSTRAPNLPGSYSMLPSWA